MSSSHNIYLMIRATLAPEHRLGYLAQLMLPTDWAATYALAVRWGVKAMAWAGYERLHPLLPEALRMPRELKLQWYSAAQATNKLAADKRHTIEDFAAATAAGGVKRLAVLKGVAYSLLYPNNEWREYGDLDCYAFDDYDLVHQAATAAGATVEDDHCKHSHVYYRDLMVENHRYLTSFNGNRRRHCMENFLHDLLAQGPLTPIAETSMLQPSPEFTAIFLPMHAVRHFCAEEIALRHILDWYFFLRTYGAQIDWPKVYGIYDAAAMRCGTDLMTQYCIERLGLRLTDCGNLAEMYHPDVVYFPRFEADIIKGNSYAVGGERWMIQKVPRIMRRWRRQWRFRRVIDQSYTSTVWSTIAWGSYAHRRLKLTPARFDKEVTAPFE